MKIKFFTVILTVIAFSSILNAQNVGINEDGSAPDPSAMLDIKSDDKGILIPRVTYDNLPATPALGLIVYVQSGSGENTHPSHPNIGPQTFYFYNGGYWQKIDGSIWAYEQDDYFLDGNFVSSVSMMVGSSATPGYDFGSYTLVIADETPRFYFDDTSNSASFPNTDWVLEANGVNPGDGDYFAFYDKTNNKRAFIIEANSADHALYVKGENIGIGTNDPLKNLHVVNGTEPTFRLEQDNTDANTPYIWDIAANDQNISIVDASFGNAMPFTVESNSPTNSLYVDSNGNTGFGTNTPQRTIHISQAMRLEPLSTPPSNPAKGDLYFDDNDNKLKCYDGTQWQDLW